MPADLKDHAAVTDHVMNWEALLSTRRFKLQAGKVLASQAPATLEAAAGLRSDFHIDHDRLVFSSAFRRLVRSWKYEEEKKQHDLRVRALQQQLLVQSLFTHPASEERRLALLPRGAAMDWDQLMVSARYMHALSLLP